MVSLESQQELINTNNWIIDLREPYVPLTIKISNIRKFSTKMSAWKLYQLVLKDS